MTTGNEIIQPLDENWKVKVLVIGGFLGICTGLAGAYVMIKKAEKEGDIPHLSPVEGIKIGLLLLSLLRNVSQI
jgi:hypothetical protein